MLIIILSLLWVEITAPHLLAGWLRQDDISLDLLIYKIGIRKTLSDRIAVRMEWVETYKSPGFCLGPMCAQDMAAALGISSDTRESEFSVGSHTDKPLNLDFSRNGFGVTKESQRRHSLQPHRVQHARLPCPSLSPRVCSDLCPLSQWWHSTISSSVAPFSSCPPALLPSIFPGIRVFSNELAFNM